MARMHLKKVWQTLSQSVSEYLVESSIHGLRYLAEGRNVLEKVGWSLIILISLYFAGTMISTSIEDNEKEPILTTIETTSIQNVPFPAITIGADGRANPWGFAQKTLNMMSFYGPDDEAVIEDSSELRCEVNSIMVTVIQSIYGALENQWKNWNLSDYKAYPDSPYSTSILKYLFRNKKIKKLIPSLAAIFLKKPSIKPSILNTIYLKLVDNFFDKNYNKVFPFYTGFISNIIEKYIKDQDYMNETEHCKNENETCIEFLKESYKILYFPSEILFYNNSGYNNLGFGTYLTYFSRLFSQSSQYNKEPDFFAFLPFTKREKLFRKMMSKAVQEFSDRNMSGISSYELVRLAHNNIDEQISDEPFWKLGPIIFKPNCTSGPNSWEMDRTSWNDIIRNPEYLKKYECFTGIEIKYGNYPKPNCCKPSDLIKNQLPTVMKIMKYSIQPAVFYEPLESFLESYDNLDFLPFNNLTKFESRKQRNLMEYNSNPRILMCQYPEGKQVDDNVPKDCQSFHVSITSEGIGYTFNNANFWDTFRELNYTKLFSKIMRPKGFKKQPSLPYGTDENDMNDRWMYPKNISFPVKSGHLHGLKVSYRLLFT